mmetsp:Transcript_87293/g.282636  ORF Transcript_87293/g.282636 Transcript_87293/m.282636 type:complete len:259 (-) Transcript_87293:227-1003(-)
MRALRARAPCPRRHGRACSTARPCPSGRCWPKTAGPPATPARAPRRRPAWALPRSPRAPWWSTSPMAACCCSTHWSFSAGFPLNRAAAPRGAPRHAVPAGAPSTWPRAVATSAMSLSGSATQSAQMRAHGMGPSFPTVSMASDRPPTCRWMAMATRYMARSRWCCAATWTPTCTRARSRVAARAALAGPTARAGGRAWQLWPVAARRAHSRASSPARSSCCQGLWAWASRRRAGSASAGPVAGRWQLASCCSASGPAR